MTSPDYDSALRAALGTLDVSYESLQPGSYLVTLPGRRLDYDMAHRRYAQPAGRGFLPEAAG